jgi:hypothetical protein
MRAPSIFHSQASSTLDDLGNRLKPLINNYTIKKNSKKDFLSF